MIEPEEMRRLEYNIGRMLRVAASDDPATFAAVYELLDTAIHEGMSYAAGRLLAADQGKAPRYSWGDLARELGITPQGARQRFTRRIRPWRMFRATALFGDASL